MKDRKLDRLFDRFRKKGDTAALARVFDATATELLGIAVHLVRDVGEGEDLVQETFLTAIEKAQRYDAERQLVPWLVGILVRHAHNARRRGARTKGAEWSDLPGGEDPAGSAQGNELADSIAEALRGLPRNYSDVLEPYLRGERAVDIARANGSAPGTVRVQLRRGLDELRRALPGGLALGASLLVGGRSLAQVRGVVLEGATQWAKRSVPLAASSASSSTLIGGLAMSNKLALGALALALLSFVGWISQAGVPVTVASLELASRETDATPLANNAPPFSPLGPTVQNPALAVQDERVELLPSKPEAMIPDPALAGAFGRLVDETGEPVVGVPIEFLQLHPGMFDAPSGVVFESALEAKLRALILNPVVGRGRTDEQGRFTLFGAFPAGKHALGIDAGGRRPTLRILEHALRSGERTDLGTLRLEPARTLKGQVLDAAGEPVVGARVRALNLPESQWWAAEVRGGVWLAIELNTSSGGIVQPPNVVADLMDRLPIPSAETDLGGRFELTGARVGELQLFADHRDHGLVVLRVEQDSQGEVVLQFAAKARFTGRVVDPNGQPVAQARVLFGPAGLGDISILAGELLTDPSGAFEFDCAAMPVVCVRRSRSSPWETGVRFADGETITLAVEGAVTIRLLDPEDAPVLGARISLQAYMGGRTAHAFLGGPPPQGVVREIGDGNYEVTGLAFRKYSVRVLANGFAIEHNEITATEDGELFELHLNPSVSRRVTVLGGGTRTPVAGARVTIRANSRGYALSGGTTDGQGHVELQGIPLSSPSQLQMDVSHPAYAPVEMEFDAESPQQREVLLSAGSEALLRVLMGNAAPSEPLQVTLKAREFNLALPFSGHQLTDEGGGALFENLPAGEWSYTLVARYMQGDAFNLLNRKRGRRLLAQGDFTVREGVRTVINVDLPPEQAKVLPAEGSGGIEGRVVIEGVRKFNPLVMVVGGDPRGGAPAQKRMGVGAGGEYRFDDLTPGKYELLVFQNDATQATPSLLAQVSFEVRHNQVLHKDVRLVGQSILVAVRDEGGMVVEDAQLQISSMEPGDKKLAACEVLEPGLVQVTVWGTGKHFMRATSATAGTAERTVQVLGLSNERFELVLDRGVPCSGKLFAPDSAFTGVGQLNVYTTTGELGRGSTTLDFQDRVSEFDLRGLKPGKYRGTVVVKVGRLGTVTFEITEEGDSTLELHVQESVNMRAANIANVPSSD